MAVDRFRNPVGVKAYTIGGDFVGQWDSVHQAKKAMGLKSTSCISRCAIGRNPKKYITAGGYVWFRADATEKEIADRLEGIIDRPRNTYPSKELLARGIHYVQKDKDGKIIHLWKWIKDAADYYGVSPSTISVNVNGETDYVRVTPRSKFFAVI